MAILRKAVLNDIDAILAVFANARAFIASYGSDQWQNGYPQYDLIRSDILSGYGFVFEDAEGVRAYAALIPDPEPAYEQLNDKWLNTSNSYLTVHRVAVDRSCSGRGIGKSIFSDAASEALRLGLSSLRVDTHRMNAPMQKLLASCGFVYCGDVRYDMPSGDPIRLCYEKILK